MIRIAKSALIVAGILLTCVVAAPMEVIPVPAERDWLALARLPDWSGIWTPDVTDQFRQAGIRNRPDLPLDKANRPPWKPEVAKRVEFLEKEFREGRPFLILKGCLPPGMPSLMTITHNAMEILFTPGRVTFLGESDGNRMRRIYTDGRPHPDDPDLTFSGHSIGRWEGDTLVVDTVGILPEAWITTDEAVGNPNNGDMHIVERIRLAGPDTLIDEMEIVAPNVLTKPWKTTRIFYRQRARKYEIVEGACVQGNFVSETDEYGNAILREVPVSEDGSVVPLGR